MVPPVAQGYTLNRRFHRGQFGAFRAVGHAEQEARAGRKIAAAAGADERPFIVGVGASAGGLEAFNQLLPNLPRDLGLSYVVVQHLSPTYRSLMVQLLARETSMPVKEIEDGARPEPNTVHITPPNRNLTLRGGRFHLVEPAKECMPKPSVNLFFASLADEAAEATIGIILSGTGSDGAAGIHAIKAAGGFTFAQEPSGAKYNGMPQSAIDTGSVDWILAPAGMGAEIALIVQNRGRIPMATQAASAPASLKTLLGKVRTRTKVDFSKYKEPTLWRRIERRMAANHVATLQDYLALVDLQPVELDKLCKDILISVTAFFRDTEAFAALEQTVVRLLAAKRPGDDIRVWVAGCATGEEAYSLAILLAEHLGSAFDQYRIQIFATDIDMEAMARARRGMFAAPSLAQMARERVKSHFTAHGDRYEINKNLRDVVIFARQDLVQDPPFLRLDLITCRNVLIYFQSELQARLLSVFHYALNPGGYMFLGKSESVFQQEGLFDLIDKEARLFRRSGAPARLPPRRADAAPAGLNQRHEPAKSASPGYEQLLVETAARYFVPLSILINHKFEIRHIHGDASRFLNIAPGKPAFDLISLIRREFRTEIQVLLREAQVKQAVAVGRSRHIKALDAQRALRLSVHPLPDCEHDPLFMVCIEWVSASVAGLAEAGHADASRDRDLEDELAATREHLQTLVEELETSNEEMQALNEEIQASNEEMQASNEELEASNEELQSTNEELATVNEELQIKTTETQELNIDLEHIQNSVDYPLLVLDQNLCLLRHNRTAAEVFKLGMAHVGRGLASLPLPVVLPDLSRDAQQVIDSQAAFNRQLVNVNKRHYALHITPLLRDPGLAGAILLFVDNTDLYETEKLARENQERLLAVMNNSVSLMAVKDATGRYQFANPRFERSLGFQPGQVVGKTDFQIFPPSVSDLFRESELEAMRLRKDIEREETLRLGGVDRHFLVVRFPLFDDDGAITGVCFQATDVTERRYAEEQLRLAARVFDRAAEGVVVTDTKQVILTVNDAFVAVTGYARAEAVGETPRLLSSGKHPPEFYTEMWHKIDSAGWWQGEIWNRKKNGELYLEWLSINTVKDQAGGVVNYVAMFSDITIVRESQNRVEFLATHDDLTGLPNRTLFNDRLRLALARSGRAEQPLAVLFLDLDNFKIINDTLGHDIGDKLLRQVAARLRECIRAEDTVARLGGDEFVLLLEQSERHEAALMAARLIRALSTSYLLDEHECFISASVGISMFPEDASDATGLMRNADTAMYRAKDQGKNAFQFFTSELAERANQRLGLENGLRRAIAHDELVLEYQPQLHIGSDTVCGAEALVRWRRDDGELVSPALFIPVAEASHLIVGIDQWVVGEACRQIVKWDALGLPPLTVSVNLSARHFRKADMVSDIIRIIGEHNVAPQRLRLEITEGVLMDVERARRMLAELVEFGLRISIDDFGTGFSSLSYLKQFPIHELKIDKSFIDGIGSNADDRAIASTIIALAGNLGMQVVAEGVESAEQHAELGKLGCGNVQGFFYARPMAPERFADWLIFRLGESAA